jgi:hypothetical protein
MIPTWTHRLLTCPQPPEKFIELALQENPVASLTRAPSNYYNPGADPQVERTMHRDGKSIHNVRIPRYLIGAEFNQWFSENIIPLEGEASIAVSNPGNGGSLGPHTDRCRDWVLIYVVKSGGPDCCTTFFHQHGHPLIRDRFVFENNYDEMDVVGVAKIPENNWVLLNGRILHSVDNISTRRITFQIDIADPTKLEKFMHEK